MHVMEQSIKAQTVLSLCRHRHRRVGGAITSGSIRSFEKQIPGLIYNRGGI